MKNKHLLFISFEKHNYELYCFLLYNPNNRMLYKGEREIKETIEWIDINYFIRDYNDQIECENNIFEISKKEFNRFLDFNFLELREMGKTNIFKLIKLEEYVI